MECEFERQYQEFHSASASGPRGLRMEREHYRGALLTPDLLMPPSNNQLTADQAYEEKD